MIFLLENHMQRFTQGTGFIFFYNTVNALLSGLALIGPHFNRLYFHCEVRESK